MLDRDGRHEPPFVIDLSLSRAPRAFKGRQNLWKDELKRIYRLVERQYRAIVQAEKDTRAGRSKAVWDDVPHVSIAIFGPSGSGKSSLLQTLVQDIESKEDGNVGDPLTGNVGVLPVLDPTTWRPTDQFLYAFLSSALETERKHQMEEEHSPPQGLSAVQLAFQEVNEYLRVVDEPERSEEHDPLGLSLQKLERHTAGLRLSEAVGRFVRELAKMFSSKLVLMPVDDLDMAPDHLMDSLKTYQSFLRHPRLIPIFTFTDRLAEELIDVHFRNQLKNGNYSPDPTGKRLTISTKMAVQMLARCFPVRNRIRLGPAPARVQRARFTTRIGHTEDECKKDLQFEQDVLELLTAASFVLFGHPDSEDAHQVKAVLRPSTLRLQMQVVDAMSDSRFRALRTPQFLMMTGLDDRDELGTELKKITRGIFDNNTDELKQFVNNWWSDPDEPKKQRVKDFFSKDPTWSLGALPDGEEWQSLGHRGYLKLAVELRKLDIGATWATIFNGATWSLLNVHRDALQELGLYLEDLYSWTPKELRSVVLNNILAQDRATRRTVVDRWFNRSDIRRSQILSLLAANIFRPWMIGEEPYGDDETPIREQLRMNLDREARDIDQRWDRENVKSFDRAMSDEGRRQVRYRLMILAPKGLLWFLNLTLGFYLPQIMARSWEDALPPDDSVRDLMDGNGWDLERAPVNAARIADAKREVFPFGMLFLDVEAYQEKLRELDQKGNWPEHLLLRIWTCCGASRGRFWATFSLWRGLGFIGAVLEKGIKYSDVFGRDPEVPKGASEEQIRNAERKASQKTNREKDLKAEIHRLIHSHILNGLLSGPIISRHASDETLEGGFARWVPHTEATRTAVKTLADDLVTWLRWNFHHVIYPMPAGNVWMGWRECFMRRLHGEAILGSLWPRLESGYVEDQTTRLDLCKEELSSSFEKSKKTNRWTAVTACEVWSEHLLEYWKGCAPILLLLLSCPILPKSREQFENVRPFLQLKEEEALEQKPDRHPEGNGNGGGGSPQENLSVKVPPVQAWLEQLDLGAEEWAGLRALWFPEEPPSPLPLLLTPKELCIQREAPQDFAPPVRGHHEISFAPTSFNVHQTAPEGAEKSFEGKIPALKPGEKKEP